MGELEEIQRMAEGREPEKQYREFDPGPGGMNPGGSARGMPIRLAERRLKEGTGLAEAQVVYNELEKVKHQLSLLMGFAEEIARTSGKTDVLNAWKKVKSGLEER